MARSRPEQLREIVDSKFGFVSHFDPKTGFYLRTGVLDDHGVDTGEDAFQAEFPHLLDIGIMGHCIHGLSGQCRRAGVQCYQSGSSVNRANMALGEFQRIVDESCGRVFQVALGGRGDPELHADFEAILEYTRAHKIVPNLTTSGFRLTKSKANLIKQYCGAAAVSWYKTEYTHRAIDLLLEAGVKTNIHFVLGRDSIDEAIELLEHQRFPPGINRVIFLLFKPVGQGSAANVLDCRDERVRHVFALMDTPAVMVRVGFDSCSVPALVNHTTVIDRACFDTCEGARFSAYITPDMQMLPCSFDQGMRWAVDLHSRSIREAWESPQFADFRSRLRDACPGCAQRELCLGGCPIVPEIVLCESRANHTVRPAQT